jgi:hypothetical protein
LIHSLQHKCKGTEEAAAIIIKDPLIKIIRKKCSSSKLQYLIFTLMEVQALEYHTALIMQIQSGLNFLHPTGMATNLSTYPSITKFRRFQASLITPLK